MVDPKPRAIHDLSQDSGKFNLNLQIDRVSSHEFDPLNNVREEKGSSVVGESWDYHWGEEGKI